MVSPRLGSRIGWSRIGGHISCRCVDGGSRRLAGSAIGGIAETQEMLDFCGEHDVHPDCEMIAMSEINDAYERLLKNDVRYRFVVDMSRGL